MNRNICISAYLLALPLTACGVSSETMGKVATSVDGNPDQADESVLPENTLDLDDDILAATGLSETEFKEQIEKLRFLYMPLVYFHGGELEMVGLWSSPTVNAYASQRNGKWRIEMHGGLARRKEITPDGFAIVACHELGHHLGGYPFYEGNLAWASSEGQSDWYATYACARWLWYRDVDRNAEFRQTVDPVLRDRCDGAWSQTSDQNLCYRAGMAGRAMANLMGALDGTTVDFAKRDSNEVTKTSTAHPAAQCRLDTAVNAALCTVSPNFDVIPGLNAVTGRNSVLAEMEAAAASCFPAAEWLSTEGYNHQDHPRCWFKNQLTGAGASASD